MLLLLFVLFDMMIDEHDAMPCCCDKEDDYPAVYVGRSFVWMFEDNMSLAVLETLRVLETQSFEAHWPIYYFIGQQPMKTFQLPMSFKALSF